MLVVGSYSGMKPAEIAYSGDSTNVVTGMTWGSWTATSATDGSGTHAGQTFGSVTFDNTTYTVSYYAPVGHYEDVVALRWGAR